MKGAKIKELGAMIKAGREAKALSLRALAQVVGIDAGTISRIESGRIAAPVPQKLTALAAALDIAAEDLYAAAGYTMPKGLPEIRLYLRAKYGVSEQVASELDAYFRKRIARKRGGPRARGDR